jgi:hypothetical protein
LSRSKHTRPEKIIAATRVRAPREPRGKDDQTSLRRMAKVLKELGITLEAPDTSQEKAPIMPRIIVKRSRPGFIHPLEKTDITSVFQFFGERCFYGLRSIKLLQGHGTPADGTLLMGRLEVPGTILLFDQPESPWFVNGSIPQADRERLERAGAKIECSIDNLHCLIHWTKVDLKHFMLFEVFLHEVGHHLIQQYKGKRSIRVARTKDHENFAVLFSQRCRETYFSDSEGQHA